MTDYYNPDSAETVDTETLRDTYNVSFPPGVDSVATSAGTWHRLIIEARPQPPQGYTAVLGDPVEEGGVWKRKWSNEILPLADIQANLKARNADKRDDMETAGVAYSFPDGDGTAQTRNARDLLNIQGIVSKGQVQMAAGNTDATIVFRDAENVTHTMTPTQAIEFGEHVADTISGYYQTKWAVEAQIDALETAQEAADFDLEAAWSG